MFRTSSWALLSMVFRASSWALPSMVFRTSSLALSRTLTKKHDTTTGFDDSTHSWSQQQQQRNGDDQLWEPTPMIEYELHEWESTCYHPATHLIRHAHLQRELNYSDIETQAAALMSEPLEVELPAMLAYASFY